MPTSAEQLIQILAEIIHGNQQREQTLEDTVSFCGGTSKLLKKITDNVLLRIIALTFVVVLAATLVGFSSYASTIDTSKMQNYPHLTAHRLGLASLTDEPRMGYSKFMREIMSFYNRRRVNHNMTRNISHWCVAHRMQLSTTRLLRDIDHFLCQASCWLKEHHLADIFCNFFVEGHGDTGRAGSKEYSANMTVLNKCLCRKMELSLP